MEPFIEKGFFYGTVKQKSVFHHIYDCQQGKSNVHEYKTHEQIYQEEKIS